MASVMRIPEFLTGLDELTYNNLEIRSDVALFRKAINSYVKREISYLRNHYTLESLRRASSDYRNAIKQHYDGKYMPFTYTNKKGFTSHIALKYFVLQKKEVTEYKSQEIKRKKSYLSGQYRLIVCNYKHMLDIAEKLLDSDSAYNIATGLLLITGRRTVEIFKTARFEYLDDYTVIFSGQAKTRDSKNAKDNFEIPVLVNSEKVIHALNRLRALKDCSQFDARQVNSLVSNALGKAVKRNLAGKGFVMLPNGNEYSFLEPKNLRSIYVHIAQKMFYPLAELNYFATQVLGHAHRTEADNYMEFMLRT